MATVTFQTSDGTTYPKIGPAAKHALVATTASTAYVDPDWNRLAGVRINGAGMTGDLVSAVSSASMSFSASQVGQLSMVFTDSPDAAILRSGVISKHSIIDYANQHLEIRGISIAGGDGGPQITVQARSRVIGTLTGPQHTGVGSWGEQDTSAWVTDRCREVGAAARVQGGFGKQLMVRNATDDTTWAMMQRAAQAVGAWCFEMENIVVFMQPTYLAAKSRARWWNLSFQSATDYTDGLVGMPGWSWSADGSSGDTLTFGLLSADAALIRPGDGVTYSGHVGDARGDWIVTQADHPLKITDPVTVSCARIVNPAKEATT